VAVLLQGLQCHCRGLIREIPIEEVQLALQSLKKNARNLRVPSRNYKWSERKCMNGIPESNVTRTCLKMGGYESTEEGLKKAFLGGWLLCGRKYPMARIDFSMARRLLKNG